MHNFNSSSQREIVAWTLIVCVCASTTFSLTLELPHMKISIFKCCCGGYCCAIFEDMPIFLLRTHNGEKARNENTFDLHYEKNPRQHPGTSTQTNHNFKAQPQYEIRVRSKQNWRDDPGCKLKLANTIITWHFKI